MKAAGILLIVASCSGLGFHMAFLYGRRIRECAQIERSVSGLAGEIRFRQTPLTEALDAAGRKETGGFSAFLRRLSERLRGFESGRFEEIWQEELACYLQTSLLGEEAELLLFLGQQLGYLDLEEQQKSLALFLEQWRRQMAGLKQEEEKKGRLYRYLGVFAGFFLAILLL
ncbi:MAG: hypothetical protein HFI39_00430 [Lachnospiraceae bacterium]|nr:hypothetical protein [Lachnospiraceae bacterium]